MENKTIETLEELIAHYKAGQRIFFDLEIELKGNPTGLDFSGSTFKECFFCIDFSQANLSNCQFVDCNLKTCNFSNADLSGASITGCAVDAAIFSGFKNEDFLFEDNYAYGQDLGKADLWKLS